MKTALQNKFIVDFKTNVTICEYCRVEKPRTIQTISLKSTTLRKRVLITTNYSFSRDLGNFVKVSLLSDGIGAQDCSFKVVHAADTRTVKTPPERKRQIVECDSLVPVFGERVKKRLKFQSGDVDKISKKRKENSNLSDVEWIPTKKRSKGQQEITAAKTKRKVPELGEMETTTNKFLKSVQDSLLSAPILDEILEFIVTSAMAKISI